MKERPILFSAPMVRAILEGRKTQTRRLVKLRPGQEVEHGAVFSARDPFMVLQSPYGGPGDRLWVRETHAQFMVGDRTGFAPQCVAYRATCDADGGFDYVNGCDEVMRIRVTKWTPAIHMPRWASRITLEVTGVRVERLKEISEEDAKAEGMQLATGLQGGSPDDDRGALFTSARAAFETLWHEINAKRAPWASNPWVWVVSFRRVEAAARAA